MNYLHSRSIIITIMVIFPLLISPATFADSCYSATGAESIANHISFNLAIAGCGIDRYYRETGTMPDSLIDLYNSHWIPGHLINPITGNGLDYYAEYCNAGEMVIEKKNSESVLIYFTTPNGELVPLEINSSMYDYCGTYGVDLKLSIYQTWVQEAFVHYWREYADIPHSINDLITTGYWPFDGSEFNPITLEPLKFDSYQEGDIRFKFTSEFATCIVNYENNRFGAARIDYEAGSNIYHY